MGRSRHVLVILLEVPRKQILLGHTHDFCMYVLGDLPIDECFIDTCQVCSIESE